MDVARHFHVVFHVASCLLNLSYLKHENKRIILSKTRGAAEGFRYDKTRVRVF